MKIKILFSHAGIFDVDHPDQDYVFMDGKVKEVPDISVDVANGAVDGLRNVASCVIIG